MAIGQFNIYNYLAKMEKVYEEAEAKAEETKGSEKEGLIIPEVNKKSYDWLKKEYEKGKTEVKVEITTGGSKFEPGFDMQAKTDSVKDFKPGMFGSVKTSDTPSDKKNTPEETKPAKELGGVKIKANFKTKEDEKKKEDKKEE